MPLSPPLTPSPPLCQLTPSLAISGVIQPILPPFTTILIVARVTVRQCVWGSYCVTYHIKVRHGHHTDVVQLEHLRLGQPLAVQGMAEVVDEPNLTAIGGGG